MDYEEEFQQDDGGQLGVYRRWRMEILLDEYSCKGMDMTGPDSWEWLLQQVGGGHLDLKHLKLAAA